MQYLSVRNIKEYIEKYESNLTRIQCKDRKKQTFIHFSFELTSYPKHAIDNKQIHVYITNYNLYLCR